MPEGPLKWGTVRRLAMMGDLSAISAGERMMGKPGFRGRCHLRGEKLLALAVEKMVEIRQSGSFLDGQAGAHSVSQSGRMLAAIFVRCIGQ